MRALYTFDWRTRIAVSTSILRHSSPRGRASLFLRFMNAVFARLEIPITDSLIPASYHCDTWQCRTEGERLYPQNLIECTLGDPGREPDHLWRNQRSVTNDAIFWTLPFLPPNFCNMKRGSTSFSKIRYVSSADADRTQFISSLIRFSKRERFPVNII